MPVSPTPPPKASGYDLLFRVDDRPSLIKTLLYGSQWALLFLPTITVSAGVVAGVLDYDTAARSAFMGRILLVSGVLMVFQTLWGHRYPLIDGPSSVVMLTLITLAPLGSAAIGGGFLCGGLLLGLLGFSRLFRHVARLFTDRVVGVITALIPMSLIPFLLPLVLGKTSEHPSGSPLIMGVSILVMLIMILFSTYLKGVHQSYSFLWTVVVGTGLMGLIGEFRVPTSLAVDPWLSLPTPLLGPAPQFHPVSVITFLFAYLAVLANEVGSVYSIAEVVGDDSLEQRLDRGIGFTGIGGILSGFMPSLGTVSYAVSPGVVFATRVASRFPLTACGLLVTALAFSGKITALLASIPLAVVGAALFVIMGSQVMVGMSIIFKGGREVSSKDYYVVGVPLLLGTAASIMPENFLQLLPLSLRVLVGNGLVVGIVSVLLLEHVVLRKKKTAGR